MLVANIIEDGRLAGPQHRLIRVARLLRSMNCRTVVICPKENGKSFGDACHDANIPIHHTDIVTPGGATSRWLLYVVRLPWDLWVLRKTIKAVSPDLVHVSGGSWQIRGILAAWTLNLPVAWHLNDTYVPWPVRFFFKYISRLPSGYIFASEATKEYYRVMVRPQCLDGPVIPSCVDVERFRQKEHEKKNRLVLGTVASINPVKNIQFLIELVSYMRSNHGDYILKIAGPVYHSQGEYLAFLRGLCESRGVTEFVLFEGPTSDVPTFMASIDVYICSSHFESSPTAVWEGMAAGLPIVSSAVGDVARHVENGVSGFVLQDFQLNAWAEALQKLGKNPDIRQCMGNLGRSHAKTSFSSTTVAQATLKMYLSILAA